jgi:hypothetical protein
VSPVDFGPTAGSTWSGSPTAAIHLISPARGEPAPLPEPDRIYVTTPQGLVSMRFTALTAGLISVCRQDGLLTGSLEPPRRSSAPMGGGLPPSNPISGLAGFGGEALKTSTNHGPAKNSPTSAPTTPPGPTAARRSPGPSAPASSAYHSIPSPSPVKSEREGGRQGKPKRRRSEAQARGDRRVEQPDTASGTIASRAKIVTMRRRGDRWGRHRDRPPDRGCRGSGQSKSRRRTPRVRGDHRPLSYTHAH